MLMMMVLKIILRIELCLLKSEMLLIIIVVIELILVSWLEVGDIELMWLIRV